MARARHASRTTARAAVSTLAASSPSPTVAVSPTTTRPPSSFSSTVPETVSSGARVVVRDDDRPAEAHAVRLERAGVAGPVGDHAAGLGHREHAVGDDVGQADGLRDALVPVDDVEVAARAAVA